MKAIYQSGETEIWKSNGECCICHAETQVIEVSYHITERGAALIIALCSNRLRHLATRVESTLTTEDEKSPMLLGYPVKYVDHIDGEGEITFGNAADVGKPTKDESEARDD